MTDEMKPAAATMDDALAITRDLRLRCDWDRVQTHESLRPYLLEEAYETDDAIASGRDDALRDELGDLFLQVLFHAVVAEERGAFSIDDIAGALVTKMRVRHPHLYGDGIKRPWESLKAARVKRDSLDDGIPKSLPSLHRALRLQDRAAGVGFDWPDSSGPLAKVREETDEVAVELAELTNASRAPGAGSALESELGDLLFAVVNVCRKARVHPALALDRANAKFVRRYDAMITEAAQQGLDFASLSLEQQDELWNAAKRSERASDGGVPTGESGP